jgi:multisubunit Na+/H+ antiporter MnhB subunit
VSPRSALVEAALRLLYPGMLAAALWVLLRGHNEPGGGFIGGVVAVTATAAWATVFGVQAARRRLPLGPTPLAAVGLALALASGLPALMLGRPYLTHLWTTVPLGLTDLKVSTVLLFDLGVFCVVWGALAGFVLALLPERPAGGEGRP